MVNLPHDAYLMQQDNLQLYPLHRLQLPFRYRLQTLELRGIILIGQCPCNVLQLGNILFLLAVQTGAIKFDQPALFSILGYHVLLDEFLFAFLDVWIMGITESHQHSLVYLVKDRTNMMLCINSRCWRYRDIQWQVRMDGLIGWRTIHLCEIPLSRCCGKMSECWAQALVCLVTPGPCGEWGVQAAAGIQGGQDRVMQSAVPCKPPSRDVTRGVGTDGDDKKVQVVSWCVEVCLLKYQAFCDDVG